MASREEMHTTMCGLSPVVTALAALKEMGATKGETVLYQTSGEITGDYTGDYDKAKALSLLFTTLGLVRGRSG